MQSASYFEPWRSTLTLGTIAIQSCGLENVS